MSVTLNAFGHTLKNGPCGPTDTNAPLDHATNWSETEPTSNATDSPVSIVPQMTQGSFPEVRRALFGTTNEPTETKPLSASEEEEPPDDEADDGPWIINAIASALLDELEEVEIDDVPVCSCGRYCDVQTLGRAWHCSHCDPNAEDRRKPTQTDATTLSDR